MVLQDSRGTGIRAGYHGRVRDAVRLWGQCPPGAGPPPPPALFTRFSPAESRPSLLYHFTAVSSPAPGAPAFWVSGWLGPQQYLSYNNLRAQAEPCGAWVWENQVSWYWEKETTDLRKKEKLFLDAFQVLTEEGPHTLQGLLGCELNPDNTSVPVAKFALNGEDFMEFDLKLGAWNGDWPEALAIGQRWARQADAVNNEKTFLLYSCPHRLLGHLERGRGNLEWKGKSHHLPQRGCTLRTLCLVR
uniref:Fc fragment of IgG receptor and transporter n=1 Tax=Equus asinus asinus TaxID=83772 RepID=A0A8C4L4T3_EQUAS